MNGRPHVAILPLGGTISCVPHEGGGVRPSTDPGYMRSVLDEAGQDRPDLPMADIVETPWQASAELGLARLVGVAEQARQLVDDGACGVVITTGTDTLEEAAFLLDLIWPRSEPLVLTGAMRHSALPGNDGPANLRDALRVAAHPHSREQGVLVTVSGSIHQGWQIRKAHTGLLPGFHSVVSGPYGAVQEDTVRVFSAGVIDRPHFALTPQVSIPAVALLTATLGDDGRLLSSIYDLGYRGLVIEAMGGGSVPPAWVAPLEKLVGLMPVAYSSRTLAGPALRSTYGGVGAELDLRRMGICPAGLLDGLKSRLLLGLLLATGAGRTAIDAAFGMFDEPTSSIGRPRHR